MIKLFKKIFVAIQEAQLARAMTSIKANEFPWAQSKVNSK